MSTGIAAKLQDMLAIQEELLEEHKETQQFNLETYGAREFNPDESTTASRAAEVLGDVVESIFKILEIHVPIMEDGNAVGCRTCDWEVCGTYPCNTIQALTGA